MTRLFFNRLLILVLICSFSYLSMAQTPGEIKKPYKIHTNGKQVTVKSSKNIKNVMVWTASGHRIVEQKEVNTTTFTFDTAAATDKVFFLMIQYEGARPFTEKIGVR